MNGWKPTDNYCLHPVPAHVGCKGDGTDDDSYSHADFNDRVRPSTCVTGGGDGDSGTPDAVGGRAGLYEDYVIWIVRDA